MYNTYAGPNSVAEYQVAGLPYVSRSSGVGTIEFPFVAQWVIISNLGGADVTVGFTSASASANRITLIASQSMGPMPLKVKDLFIFSGGTWEVVAGLTSVPREKMWKYVTPPQAGSLNVTSSFDNNNFNTGFGYPGI